MECKTCTATHKRLVKEGKESYLKGGTGYTDKQGIDHDFLHGNHKRFDDYLYGKSKEGGSNFAGQTKDIKERAVENMLNDLAEAIERLEEKITPKQND